MLKAAAAAAAPGPAAPRAPTTGRRPAGGAGLGITHTPGETVKRPPPPLDGRPAVSAERRRRLGAPGLEPHGGRTQATDTGVKHF